MKSEQIINNINHPEAIGRNDITALEQLLTEYPYFQSGQLLLTKGLLNTDSIRYNRQLKKAAAYAYDRKKLFGLIIVKKAKKIEEQVKEDPNLKPALDIGKPLEFDENESHSFSEWLALSKVRKIERGNKPRTENFIDDFIDNDVRISKPKKETFFKPFAAAKESLIENDELVTPTLAKVYLEQGHYEKAILAYEKLSLKYPEKNSFFADQIKAIKDLQQK